jgi:ribosomal protein S18 acetylase RimI-like enzyme
MRKQALNVTFRDTVHRSDPEAIFHLTESCKLFYPEETAVARELAEERLARGPSSGYEFLFAETDGIVIGYTCFGPIPLTQGRFDLYWIAIQKDLQGTGIGRRLLQLTELRIQEMKGRRIYVETSSRKPYAPTHRFYHSCGYHQEAILTDFYAPGDDKVIYMKAFICH